MCIIFLSDLLVASGIARVKTHIFGVFILQFRGVALVVGELKLIKVFSQKILAVDTSEIEVIEGRWEIGGGRAVRPSRSSMVSLWGARRRSLELSCRRWMLRAVKYDMTAATRSTLRIEGRSILLDLLSREGCH